MDRQELIDEVYDALSNAQDMDTTLTDYAKAAVKAIEPHLKIAAPTEAEWEELSGLISAALNTSFAVGQAGYGKEPSHSANIKATKALWLAFFKLMHRRPA